MHLSKYRDGDKRYAVLILEAIEIEFLRNVLTDLVATLAGEVADEAVMARLFPQGYLDDKEASEEFRDLTEKSLSESKLTNARRCLANLGPVGDPRDNRVKPTGDPLRAGHLRPLAYWDTAKATAMIDLDWIELEQWLQSLNDLRLTFGTQLGITAEYDGENFGDEGERELHGYYQWLTMLQDELVQAVIGG
jgi:hypothetical protein